MASDVKICSNALLLIGHNAISALSEQEQAEAFYDSTYEDFLTQHSWNFAKRKVQLSRLTATPLNEFSYAFQLPSDMLRILRTYPSTRYKIFGDKLYSNHSEVEIDYIYRVSEGDLPAYCVTALEFLFASKFAIPVTSNKSTAEEYRKAYEGTSGVGGQLRRAKFLDSQSAPQDEPSDQPFMQARQSGI